MLKRTLTLPTIRVGQAHVTVSQDLASRTAKVAAATAAEALQGVKDASTPEQALAHLSALKAALREAASVLDSVERAARDLAAAGDALTSGQAEGASPIISLALEISANRELLKAADDGLDLSAISATAERLLAVAVLILDDVERGRKTLSLAEDRAREAVDTALAQPDSDVIELTTGHQPSPRMAQEISLAKAITSEAIRAVAGNVLRAKQAEQRNAKEAREAAARREFEQTAQAIWQGAAQ